MKGLIHLYTGNGKGKSTSALGAMIRALGSGMNVYYTQFLKNTKSSELKFLEAPNSNIHFGYMKKINKFIFNMNEDEFTATKHSISDQFTKNIEDIYKNKYDLAILDELINVVSLKLIPLKEIISFLRDKPSNTEIILTGRNAPKELIDISDYVSEINEIKHPFKKGISSRKGIEF
ncbi:MAG: cob(I)yrinic acid a,c-diamide adenosyltransferase [Clostridiales bacterium]